MRLCPRLRLKSVQVMNFKYYDYADIESEERFNEYVTQAKSRSFYDTGVNTVYGDSLITLSTCAYHTSNERFVVIARKK